ncbi:MAG: DMT family transporter [Chitinophagaceae bacterium]|nr:DMT family transporter [Chitinophagaceae bacterium]MCW5927727.1 DMT family transporter [Chitinophagaceae bacterium]
MQQTNFNNYRAIAMAVAAVAIWSLNFIIAKAAVDKIPPVALSFFRWSSASLVLLPFAFRATISDFSSIRKNFFYLLWVSLFGIALFNTFIYIGGHHTTATNLALIGTTASPIISILLARLFLSEKIDIYKLTGILLCAVGIFYLLAKGNWHNLINFRFTLGDQWVLLGAACFAVYNILVKKKPREISAPLFLFVTAAAGSIMLLPFYLLERGSAPVIEWNRDLVLIILFLGAGASVIAYLCWNAAINTLGAGRTALFGNLIPIFSSFEAALILNEQFTRLHAISMLLVFAGIFIANLKIIKN